MTDLEKISDEAKIQRKNNLAKINECEMGYINIRTRQDIIIREQKEILDKFGC